MDITVTTEIKNENIYIPFEKFNMESGIRIKIEQDAEVEVKLKADTKIKIEPIEEFDRSMEIINNMIIPTNAEIKNENIYDPHKIPNHEMNFKPKTETDFKVKSEPNDDIDRGMKIIDCMNISAKVENFEIQNGNLEIQSENLEIQDENLEMQYQNVEKKYKCFVCSRAVKFSAINLWVEHMSTTHAVYVDYVFKKNHNSCSDRIWIKRISPTCIKYRAAKYSVSKMTTWDKIFHMIDCLPKIEPIEELSMGKEVSKLSPPGNALCNLSLPTMLPTPLPSYQSQARTSVEMDGTPKIDNFQVGRTKSPLHP